jgi:hypothetical protein
MTDKMYYKYLKYKRKYLELCNLIGGGEKTAKTYFVNQFLVSPDLPVLPEEYDQYISMSDETIANSIDYANLSKEIRTNIKKIRENNKKTFMFNRLKGFIMNDITQISIVNINLDNQNNNNKEELEIFFNLIYENLKTLFKNNSLLNEQIDFIIYSYINNTFGISSSFENIGRFIEAINSYKKIITYQDRINPEIKGEIMEYYNMKSLVGLEEYLRTPKIQEAISIISNIEGKTEKIKLYHIELKKKGESKPIFETENVKIFNPQTEEQSRFHGSNTEWCTAARQNCMFNNYNDKGPLYIFESKKQKKQVNGQMIPIKYQLHIETDSLMDMNDKPVSLDEMFNTFDNDERLKDFFKELLLSTIELIIKDDIYIKSSKIMSDFFKIPSDFIKFLEFNIVLIKKINKIEITGNLQLLQDKILKKYISDIPYIIYNINEPLDNKLDNLINLQTLELGNNYKQPLGYSLDNLINLQTLKIYNLEIPLGRSLYNLINLQTLEFTNYDQPLDNSLDKLIKLQTLKFSINFNQPLGNSLDKLINLQTLKFGRNFNQPLGNSLDKLINLQTLEFGRIFNQPLGNSLDKLINLQKLYFDFDFNQPLGNSLDKLTQLKELSFLGFIEPMDVMKFMRTYKMNDFNQPLDHSLDNLINLETLIFSYDFNQPLNHSLDNLKQLKTLQFGKNFSNNLGNSLDNLINLKKLVVFDNYIYPFDHILKKIPNLNIEKNDLM